MSQPDTESTADAVIPMVVLDLIDGICDRFESAWREGRRPRVEDYLGEVEESYRAALLCHLIAAELDARRRLGEQPEPGEWHRRFPGQTAAIQSAFCTPADALSAEPTDRSVTAQAGVGAGLGQTELVGDRFDGSGNLTIGDASMSSTRYRVLRPHASGGLGAVFVALDEELHREVALKHILERHADDPASRSRFVLEAEITGGLEHPGIVPVYGLGAYSGGRPFYAMRFIRGETLKDAIERFHAGDDTQTTGNADGAPVKADRARSAVDPGARSLELRKLLRRFLDVCNAIDYAHSRGVLHRDLKPGNVIVGKHGETLVVDWGLAKVLSRAELSADQEERPLIPASASGSAQTLPGSALGTPAYMSPEQAAGDLDRLGMRSDVYSLGATLYCLLTGKAPFQGDDIGALLEAVRRGNPTPLRKINPSIEGALEAVCQKAMANSPADRYASARALADDVERWLADEPVSAGREPVSVRLRRWTRRHRSLVTGAAGLLVATTVAFAVGTLLLGKANARTEQRRVEAEQNYEMARLAVQRYYERVSQDRLLNEPHMARLRKDLLETAREFYQQFVEERKGDPRARADLAKAHGRLADIARAMGDRKAALAHAERYRALFETLAAEHPEVADHRHQLARGLLVLSNFSKDIGQTAQAETALKRALAILQSVTAEHPEITECQSELAACEERLGTLYADISRPTEAEPWYQKALSILQRLASEHPENAWYRRAVAMTYISLAGVYRQSGRATESEATVLRALELFEKLAAEHPEVADYQSNLAQCHTFLGDLHREAFRMADAETSLKQALSVKQKLAADYPEIVEYQDDVANVYSEMASVYERTKRSEAGEESLRESLAIRERLVAAHPERLYLAVRLAGEYANRGYAALGGRRDLERAVAQFDRAASILESVLHREPRHAIARDFLLNTMWGRAVTLTLRGNLAAADADWDRALELDNGRFRDQIRAERCLARAMVGDFARALTEAEAVAAAAPGRDGLPFVFLAAVAVRAATAAGDDTALDPSSRAARVNQLIVRANGWLGRARIAGYFDNPDNLTRLRSDGDLAPLWLLPDYQRLVHDTAFPANPFNK
jgi:serine/threonine-protein kinase